MGISVAVVAIIVLGIWSFGPDKPAYEVATVVRGDVVSRVSVTGKVVAFEKADLGFEKAGILRAKYAKVGDAVTAGQVIAMLDAGEASAALVGAKAALTSAQADFAGLQRGLRPEELTIEQTKVDSAQVIYNNAKTNLVNAMAGAYIYLNIAVRSYADIFFNDPQSMNPTTILRTDSQAITAAVNNDRIIAGEQLRKWKDEITTGTIALETTRAHIYVVGKLLTSLKTILGAISPNNSGQTQATIDAYDLAVNTALSNYSLGVDTVATAESTFKNAESALALAKDQFSLKKLGSSAEAIISGQASAEEAAANVASLQSALAKTRIISPINGILTQADPEVGEFIAAGKGGFAVMSTNSFKIEVYVPEANIANVSVGNKASVTLDAYSDDVVFTATVLSVNPAETIVDGVPTYKVTLQFDLPDPRIRSGMTANIDLNTAERTDVLIVPSRAISGKKVKLLEADGKTVIERTVSVGLRGSNGKTEILEGLRESDQVITATK